MDNRVRVKLPERLETLANEAVLCERLSKSFITTRPRRTPVPAPLLPRLIILKGQPQGGPLFGGIKAVIRSWLTRCTKLVGNAHRSNTLGAGLVYAISCIDDNALAHVKSYVMEHSNSSSSR